MKSTRNYLLSFAFLSLLFTSCSSDDDNNHPDPVFPDYQRGILLTNEGPFNNGSGTITFVSEDFSSVEQNIYRTVNGMELGNIVQSMGFADRDAYIVVSNSQKIMVANRYTFIAKDSIVSGFENPRYFATNGLNRGYVTDWGDPNDDSDDYVALIDLRTNRVTANIPVPLGPERILNHRNKIYVAHQGGYGFNNLITVISGNAVESTITVGDVPNSMVVAGEYLYVMSGGKPDYSGNETPGSISKIDMTSHEVVETFTFETTEHPTALTTDGSQLYYSLNSKVYKTPANAISLPGTPILEGSFYAMEARDGKLYATDAKDFASRGSLYVFDLSTNLEIHNVKAGIVPGGIYFNE